MSRPHLRYLLALLPWLSAPAFAAQDSYRYDLVHSQVIFSVDHDGFSRPMGRFHLRGGWLRFDPQDVSHAATELDIDVQGVDLGDSAWNQAACKPGLLDCEHYATAHFASTSVQPVDASHMLLHGTLTLHGVAQPVDLNVRLNRIGTTIYGMHKVAGFSATASLDRTAFGINGFPNAIGHQIALWLELEAIRDDHATSPTKDQP